MPEFGSYPEKESPAAGDFLLVLDGDDDATKKVDVGNLPSGGGGFAGSWLRARSPGYQLSTEEPDPPDLSWDTSYDDNPIFGVSGNDLRVNEQDPSLIDVLTTGVYAVTVSSYVSGIDYGYLRLTNVDPAITHWVPYVWNQGGQEFFATFSWTGRIEAGNDKCFVESVVWFEDSWIFNGHMLTIQRLA